MRAYLSLYTAFLRSITVTCLCYLVAFEYVCSAFTLVRRHGKTKDSGQLFVNSHFFAIFTYVSWTIPFYTQHARLKEKKKKLINYHCCVVA